MRRFAIFMLPVALAACDSLGGGGVELTNASIAEVAAASKGTQKQQPGAWETTTQLEKMELGEMAGNPQMAALLQKQIGQKQVIKTCLTKEQSETPTFGDLDKIKDSTCRFDRFAMNGGTLDAVMRCKRPDGALSVTQKGSYTATAFDLRSTVSQAKPGQPNTTMTMHIAGKRTGDCKA